ncbi:MAG: ABC transporter permease [Acidimicrobiales bacterium]
MPNRSSAAKDRLSHQPLRRLPRVNVLGLLTAAAFVGAWELAVRSGLVDFDFLPAPSGIAASLFSTRNVVASVVHTLRSTLVGWLIAGVLGVVLGLGLGFSDRAWRWSMASIEVVRAIPPIALVPVALLLFGFSLEMELTLIVYVGTWTVLVNTIDGVRGVRAEILDVGRILRLSTFARIRKLVLPAAMGSIVVGLRLALSLALVLAVVAEMIGNPRGLGNALVRAQQALQPEQMFAYVLIIGVIGVGLNSALRWGAALALPALAAGPAQGPVT